MQALLETNLLIQLQSMQAYTIMTTLLMYSLC